MPHGLSALAIVALLSTTSANAADSNEVAAAKAAIADATKQKTYVDQQYSTGFVSALDQASAAVKVEAAKLNLAVTQRSAADAVAVMTRVVALEESRAQVAQRLAQSGMLTVIDTQSAQIELVEQRVQLQRAKLVELRQQQVASAEQLKLAGFATASDVAGYQAAANRAWEDLKDHLAH